MLKKIDEKSIITLKEAGEKYFDCHYLFIFTEMVGHVEDESKGYVIYTYNKFSESRQIPQDEIHGKPCGFFFGYAADPYPKIGSIYYE